MEANTQSLQTLQGAVRINKQQVSQEAINLGNQIYPVPVPGALTFVLDNSGDAVNDKVFVIGDPSDAIRGAVGYSAGADPTSLNGTAAKAAAFKAGLNRAQLMVSEINYETETSATQFSAPFEVLVSSLDGEAFKRSINIHSAKRGNNLNGKILTLRSQVIIDSFRALALTVKAGETVTLTLVPVAIKV